MSLDRNSFQASIRDFQEARLQAALRDVLARVTRRSDELLSYDQVAEQLHLSTRVERGIRTIPVAAIVGSVGRYADFTRTFLPRRAGDEQRWARVRSAFLNPNGKELPAIEVYQVGEAYFVLDGNHRVSVARREGIAFLEAHVIEIKTPVPLTPDVEPDDLICKAEYADFLASAGLENNISNFDLSVSEPGQYPKLLEQITAHRYLLNQASNTEITQVRAAADWLEKVYAPIALAIRERGVLRWFPNRTETDLYIWVCEHRDALEEELGWAVRPEAAVTDLAVRNSARAKSEQTATGKWSQERIVTRYLDRLFADLLVPITHSGEAWNALEQAIIVAQKENAVIRGLHIVENERAKASDAVQALRAKFQERIAATTVQAELIVEVGDIARKICERALLTDLIVLGLAHPPALGLATFTSRMRSILRNAARPVLVVPNSAAPLARVLLAFDGGSKSKESLFVAAYMGENWDTHVTVLTIRDGVRATSAALDYARAYLTLHEVDAEYILSDGPESAFLETLRERNLDVLLMGNYSVSQWDELRGHSAVSYLLRESPQPLLICQ